MPLGVSGTGDVKSHFFGVKKRPEERRRQPQWKADPISVDTVIMILILSVLHPGRIAIGISVGLPLFRAGLPTTQLAGQFRVSRRLFSGI
jgi:hypothetical protein